MSADAWRLQAQTTSPGWLGLPIMDGDAQRAQWVQAQAVTMREHAGVPWDEGAQRYIRTLLEVGSTRRRADDVLAYQVWPAAVPACVFVHVAFGELPEAIPLPAPGDALPYEAEGVGPGLQIPLLESTGDGELLGLLFLFRGAGGVLTVELEPTAPELVTLVMPALHGLIQSITVMTDRPFRAEPLPLPGTADADTWVDSLRAS